MRVLLMSILFLLWVCTGSWYWLCKVRNQCLDQQKLAQIAKYPWTQAPKSSLQPLSIYEEAREIKSFHQNFVFRKSDFVAELNPVNTEILDSISVMLEEQPDKDMEIVGNMFAKEEINQSVYSTLGLARASFIRSQLIERGVDPSRLFISYQNLPYNPFTGIDSLWTDAIEMHLIPSYSGILPPISVSGIDSISVVDPIGNDSIFSEIILFIDPTSGILEINKPLRDKIQGYLQYLRAYPDSWLRITGHTDNTGLPKYNIKLGKNKAELAKKYFVDFGVRQDQIFTESLGDQDPIDTNNTEDGRRQNRRIEAIILADSIHSTLDTAN